MTAALRRWMRACVDYVCRERWCVCTVVQCERRARADAPFRAA